MAAPLQVGFWHWLPKKPRWKVLGSPGVCNQGWAGSICGLGLA